MLTAKYYLSHPIERKLATIDKCYQPCLPISNRQANIESLREITLQRHIIS